MSLLSELQHAEREMLHQFGHLRMTRRDLYNHERRLEHIISAALAQIERTINMNAAELKAQLDALNAQLAKATAEVVAEVQALKDSLSNVTIPDDAKASLDALTAKVQALDDLNPDAPAAPASPADAPAAP